MIKAKERCSGSNVNNSAGGVMPCTRAANYFERGKHWCWQHRPSYTSAKYKAMDDKIKEDMKIMYARSERQSLERIFCAELTNEELSNNTVRRNGRNLFIESIAEVTP